MKRNVNISMIVLSMLIVLIAPFIPHHHHYSEVCMMVERCEQDEDTDLDPHVEDSSGVSCVAEARYEETQPRKINEHIQANRLYPIIQQSVLYSLNRPAEDDEKPIYGGYVCAYAPPEMSNGNGLRAPPFYL